jgi:hypothetical protein
MSHFEKEGKMHACTWNYIGAVHSVVFPIDNATNNLANVSVVSNVCGTPVSRESCHKSSSGMFCLNICLMKPKYYSRIVKYQIGVVFN